MSYRIIIEGNAFYEVDEECLKNRGQEQNKAGAAGRAGGDNGGRTGGNSGRRPQGRPASGR